MVNFGKMSLQYFKLFFIVIGLGIIVLSTLFSNQLANKLAEEEKKKIDVWAEATKQLVMDESGNDELVNFLLSIIDGNTTIPIVLVDENDNLIFSRNIKEPTKNTDVFYTKEIARLKSKKTPIEVKISDDLSQYIYYDDSWLLKQLYYFPYVQFSVIGVFFLIAFFAFSSTKKAEQNKVWVGLSKETAHQLGTPISSLLAWTDLLKARHPEDELITEMGKDVNRLRVIAERFSKIGSIPDLQSVDLNETIKNSLQYMSNRSSQKVDIQCHFIKEKPISVKLNVPLFEWVIENLCKNAIDAMNGSGKIDVYVIPSDGREIYIDIKDTGKGIERKKFKTIFQPGFTTKSRGWGLGLSLVKRIVEEYHGGKIFVKQSEMNVGTTFRIILKRADSGNDSTASFTAN